MREFTKSMTSYMWAMSLFGVQQMVNVFRPSKAVESFENVTGATEEEFGDALKATFRAGDNLQRGLVDLTFGVFTLGMFSGRGGGSGTTSNVGQQSAEAFRQGMRAMGQAADTVGQTVQGASYYAADATRAAGGGGRNDARWGTNSNLGQQAADAVGQGMRAVGQAADSVGQTVSAAAYAAADVARQGADAAQQGAGWGPVGGARGGGRARGDDGARGGDAGQGGGRAGAGAARQSGPSGGQAQGWGPMPSQSAEGATSKR
jgi:hypothetical protein